ncbi:hypothetical protein [Nocardioides nematodiphilus]|uniref:hypothetical protein n=1 Tax=Nocardioides nematodiphilus TaxID=2849669 RepID=UPI001CD9E34C|nr:hypothetical protein [Nocardioides nematodiphilus]MCA1984412.1 hypothetical protein [Nocardioides nematodiphilus]
MWLLQPPPGFDSLDAALTHLSASATAAGLPILADRTFAEHVGREVARIFTQP